MKKIFIIIAVLVILGFDWSMLKSPEEKVVTPLEQLQINVTDRGTYEVYSPEKLVLAETGKVVLFFRAPWCPNCRALDADIRANLSDIPEGVTILDVDYDNSTALKQKYGVTYQHTLVQVDALGNQIAKWTSSPTLATLLTAVK